MHEVKLARQSRHSTTGTFLWDFGFLYAFRSFCCIKEFGDGFGCVIFARFLTSCRKLQVSPLEHCPLNSHCQSPRVLFLFTRFCTLILDHGAWSKFPCLASKNSSFSNSGRYFFWPLSSICDNQVLTSSDESPYCTIPIPCSPERSLN